MALSERAHSQEHGTREGRASVDRARAKTHVLKRVDGGLIINLWLLGSRGIIGSLRRWGRGLREVAVHRASSQIEQEERLSFSTQGQTLPLAD